MGLLPFAPFEMLVVLKTVFTWALLASGGRRLWRRRGGVMHWLMSDGSSALDVSLDHGDLRTWSLAVEGSRSGMICELAEALDAEPSGVRDDGGEEWRQSLEDRFADLALRLARDAELRAAARRVKSARALSAQHWRGTEETVRRGARLADDLEGPLTAVGAAERLLGTRPVARLRAGQGGMSFSGGARDRSRWAAEALTAACAQLGVSRDLVDDCLRRKRDARGAVAAALTAAAAARYGARSSDLDTLGLQTRLRRRACARVFGGAISLRCALAGRRALARRGGLVRVATDATASARLIAERRLVTPAREILDDLLLNQKKAIISDPRGLQDAEKTLRTMLDEWLEDTQQATMTKHERKRAVEALDMASVGDVLAKEVRHSVKNLINGNIVRALLIHLQFVSKETQQAMTAVDDLLAANTATIQVLALFPALFLVYGIFVTSKSVLVAVLSESVKSTDQVQREMAATLSEMKRLVLLASDEARPLDDAAYGALALQAHVLMDRLARERARFEPARLARLDRALRDLFEPGLSARVLDRHLDMIEREHAFLQMGGRTTTPPMTLLKHRR